MATFTVPARTTKTKMDLNTTQNLVDPEWELIDPIPDIHVLFQTFNNKFFQGCLACVELEWSKRMYQCAGICYSRGNRHYMSCTIRLSEPLLKLRSRKELIETLLHEMIHAWNFIRGIREENGGHGKNFLSKMNEINRMAGTNITVYHTFHDEVELYKTHWWRCDGVCKDRKPFFGFVKRTSNRAPSKNDLWWNEHQRTCGGTFIKVKEPEKKKKAAKTSEPKKKIETKKKPSETVKSPDIRKFFSGNDAPSTSKAVVPKDCVGNEDSKKSIPKTSESAEGGYKLGGGKMGGRSRLLDMFDNLNATKKIKLDDTPVINISSPPPRKSIISQIRDEFNETEDDSDIIFIDDEFDDSIGMPTILPVKEVSEALKGDFCHCPVCNTAVESDRINQHLDECLTMQVISKESS